MPGLVDAGMPQAIQDQFYRVLTTANDPVKVDEAANLLASQGYPVAAQTLRSKAMALRVAQSAADAARTVQDVMKGPAAGPAGPAATPAQTSATARTTVETSQQTAAQNPALSQAASQAATAAVTAAKAATTADPNLALQAAQEAAQAAQTAASSDAAKKAAAAMNVAKEAVLTQNPVAAKTAADMAVNAANQAAIDLAKRGSAGPPEAPTYQVQIPKTAPPGLYEPAASLAAAMTENIRSKGCWKEDRTLVKRFQEAEGGTSTTRGAAGKADGLYGPITAIAAMKYVTRVPAPCYWPKQSADKTAAQKQWADVIKAGKVTVGRQAA